jgi:hypothetical protein
MFRKLAILALVGVVAVAAYGSAATMTLQGGSEQVGIDTSLWCAQDPVEVVAWAINTYGDSGDTEGLDWVTVKLSARDALNCAGNDLTGRLDLDSDLNGIVDASHLYLGCYGDVAADCTYWPSKSVALIQAGKYEYKLAVYQRDWTTKAWPLGEWIVGIKLWVGGPADNP